MKFNKVLCSSTILMVAIGVLTTALAATAVNGTASAGAKQKNISCFSSINKQISDTGDSVFAQNNLNKKQCSDACFAVMQALEHDQKIDVTTDKNYQYCNTCSHTINTVMSQGRHIPGQINVMSEGRHIPGQINVDGCVLKQ